MSRGCGLRWVGRFTVIEGFFMGGTRVQVRMVAAGIMMASALPLVACSFGSGQGTKASSSSSSGASSATSSASEGTPRVEDAEESANADKAVALPVSTFPKMNDRIGKPVWAESRDIIGMTASIVAVETSKNASTGPRTVLGRRAHDGSTAWNLTIQSPKGVKFKESPDVKIAQVGDSLAVAWEGTTADEGLNAGSDAVYLALYDLATGKQRGQIYHAGKRPGQRPFNVQSPWWVSLDSSAGVVGYDNDVLDESGKPVNGTLFGDGTLVRDKHVPWGGSELLTTSLVAQMSPTMGLKAQNDLSFYDMTTEKSSGSMQCGGATGLDIVDNNGVATNQEWMWLGSAVANTKTRKIRCLDSLSNQKIRIISVLNDGTVIGVAGDTKGFVLPPGSNSPQQITVDASTTGVPFQLDGMYVEKVGEQRVFYKAKK